MRGHFEQTHGFVEALEGGGAAVAESEAPAEAEFSHDVGGEDLAGARGVAGAAREVHRRPEQVFVIFDRFAGAEADADAHRAGGIVRVVRVEGVLDRDGALDAARDGGERRHDTVAGVLDLAAAVDVQALADDLVVAPDEREHRVVAEALREPRRPFEVGEHDRPETGVGVTGLAHGLPLRQLVVPHVEDRVDEFLLDLDDLIGHEAVGGLVDGDRHFARRRLDEAEDLSGVLVEPVGQVAGVVPGLRIEVERVRGDHLVDRQALSVAMDVHEERHLAPHPLSMPERAPTRVPGAQ